MYSGSHNLCSFWRINEGINTIEQLRVGQLGILEEELAVRGSIVMKDGEKMKNQHENGIYAVMNWERRVLEEGKSKERLCQQTVWKRKDATEELNVLALV